MKILVIGGMHGNEPLGLEVIQELNMRKSANIDTLIANQPAVDAQKRFKRIDLNRVFPGQANSADYELHRAAEIITLCKQYDLVLDFHNTHCADNDCVFVGASASKLLYDVAGWLDLNRVIVADYDCLNKYAPNCISIEISLDSVRINPQEWVTKITQLSCMSRLPSAQSIALYRFAYRMTLQDRDRLELDTQELRAFKRMKAKTAAALGFDEPVYPIFIADAYTPYNFGGLLTKIKYNEEQDESFNPSL